MEIFFNELSVLPSCPDDRTARIKIINLLETMKSLQKHDFNVLRTHNNFYVEDLGNGYTFSRFVNDPLINRTIKTLLLGVIKSPFILDEDSFEAEEFILNTFTTSDSDENMVSPEGGGLFI